MQAILLMLLLLLGGIFLFAFTKIRARREEFIDSLIRDRNGFWEKFNLETIRADEAELKRDMIKRDWKQLARHYNSLVAEYKALQQAYNALKNTPHTPPLTEGITHATTEMARNQV